MEQKYYFVIFIAVILLIAAFVFTRNRMRENMENQMIDVYEDHINAACPQPSPAQFDLRFRDFALGSNVKWKDKADKIVDNKWPINPGIPPGSNSPQMRPGNNYTAFPIIDSKEISPETVIVRLLYSNDCITCPLIGAFYYVIDQVKSSGSGTYLKFEVSLIDKAAGSGLPLYRTAADPNCDICNIDESASACRLCEQNALAQRAANGQYMGAFGVLPRVIKIRGHDGKTIVYRGGQNFAELMEWILNPSNFEYNDYV